MPGKGIQQEKNNIICEYCGKKIEGQKFVITTFYARPMSVCKLCYMKLVLDTSFLIAN